MCSFLVIHILKIFLGFMFFDSCLQDVSLNTLIDFPID